MEVSGKGKDFHFWEFLVCSLLPRAQAPAPGCAKGGARGAPYWWGWRKTVELVLFGISNSMKPYPSAFHAYTGNCCFEPKKLDEVSNRILPTSHYFSLCSAASRGRALAGGRRGFKSTKLNMQSSKQHEICSDPSSADPSCPFPMGTSAKTSAPQVGRCREPGVVSW